MDLNSGVIRYANENLSGYTGTDVKGYFETQFQRPAAVLNAPVPSSDGMAVYWAA